LDAVASVGLFSSGRLRNAPSAHPPQRFGDCTIVRAQLRAKTASCAEPVGSGRILLASRLRIARRRQSRRGDWRLLPPRRTQFANGVRRALEWRIVIRPFARISSCPRFEAAARSLSATESRREPQSFELYPRATRGVHDSASSLTRSRVQFNTLHHVRLHFRSFDRCRDNQALR